MYFGFGGFAPFTKNKKKAIIMGNINITTRFAIGDKVFCENPDGSTQIGVITGLCYFVRCHKRHIDKISHKLYYEVRVGVETIKIESNQLRLYER